MITVRNETEFKNAILNSEPEIYVENDVSLTTPTTVGYSVSITGAPDVSLFWATATQNRTMLIVSAAGDLVIGSLILDAEGRNGTLVHIQGGKFTMNDGAVLKNISGMTSQNAVRVGGLSDAYGGTFIMNGGLITGISSSDAVFCGGASVIMNNNAAIDGNMSAGLSSASTVGARSSLTMTGNSRISNNQSRQGASAGILMDADIVMGVQEGDAPLVTGNRSPEYPIGGWLLTDACSLTMRYGAKISDNYSIQYGGGVVAQDETAISMYDDAAIENNTSDNAGGGLILLTGSTLTMEGNSRISGNTCKGAGGGLHLQSGSTVIMKGSSAVNGNIAANGAGIYLYNSTASIGDDDSSPSIYDNSATGNGGGVFITGASVMNLAGESGIYGNTATQGSGIYKLGVLNLSQSPRILDGLFFDCPEIYGPDVSDAESRIYADAARGASFQIPLDASGSVLIEMRFANDTSGSMFSRMEGFLKSDAVQQAYCENVPVIADTLTDRAIIQLESSEYVSPRNVALVIADKGENCDALCETDRAAWRVPEEFIPGHAVLLTDAFDQVLITRERYNVTYKDLFGAENPNPDSYDISELPIALIDPGIRPGYAFKGWYDEAGERVFEISEGMTGDLCLTAVWEKLTLSFDANAPCACNVPKSMHVKQGKVSIPTVTPCRRGYSFICWNIPDSGSGKAYFPGDSVIVSDCSIKLYAQWQPNCCCCGGRD